MNYLSKVVIQIVLWAFSTFLFISILFLPVNTNFKAGESGEFQSAEYNYSFKHHVENMKFFISYIKENKGLGEESPGRSYMSVIGDKVKKSSFLILPALFLGFVLGIIKGILDFQWSNKKLNFLGKGTTWLFLSIPDIFFIIMIQIGLMFLYHKGLFIHVDLFGSDKVENYVMCILFLAIYPIFYIANITNASLQDEMGNDYIRTAKSKGTGSFRILYIHILKNAMAIILSHANTVTLYVLSNLFIVEKLTDFKGAGYGLFQAVFHGSSFRIGLNVGIDGISAVGYTIFFTLIILFTNILAQIGKTHLSPHNVEVSR
ncbi:ABC transporter permease subunit [Falsibacillus pallidus]|uniref:ABC-type dipeptide/oligopeptide/nickel transport system permease component n=1 Tax=Falsibacillus pallidus TaxID=493781 RepID=A0A370G5Q3_9BACI|nr:ABC transporter permease subunit [Falsibacillus pallidus]RDI39148.1 ABC-type dipeptide/oligopeptide/nickel transport system permease component [Falsibacillus pallidus]